jgi:hypothetical protein
VEEDLHDRRPLVDEQPLERANVALPPAPDFLGYEAAHAHGDDVLVVGAIEDPNLAALWARRVDAPKVVVRELGRVRFLERHDPAALRVDPREDALDRPVLAGGVEALEHQQETALVLGVEPVVQEGQLLYEHRELFSRRGLSGEPGMVVRLTLAQGRRSARLDHQLREHTATLHGYACVRP